MHCVGWPPVPALYNAPVFAASAVNVMAAQSVSIDKYPKGEQQVGEREKFGLGSNLLHWAKLHCSDQNTFFIIFHCQSFQITHACAVFSYDK